MDDRVLEKMQREALGPLRILADQAFARAAGAPLLSGNRIRLLRDATENYPAWLDAIQSARRTIHFESYIIHADDVGRQFAEVLEAKAREGVQVRLIYDWFGALGNASRRFWRSLRSGGVEVRCFNPPRLDSPLGWLSRDHRKLLTVDSRISFVTGLCVGRRWVGDPARGIEPWRDTGVEIQGPGIADLERAFAQMWGLLGPPLPVAGLPGETAMPPAGDVDLRIVASHPNVAGLYRFDQLIAALARRSIWLTDAYFLGTTTYLQALVAAASDGVDVRLLLPRTSDVPIVRSLSRTGYRTLLEAGVRIFEWNGPMLHAKTAVADGRWARVGSTNLNLSSWVGNWELDVVVEDEPFAQQMETMYLDDLAHSTEIVLTARQKVPQAEQLPRPRPVAKTARGSAGRAMTGLLKMGNTVGAAITSRRPLGPAEVSVMLTGAVLLLCLVVLGAFIPWAVTLPVIGFSAWLAFALVVRAYRLYVGRNK
jgi:cardiolipin synthase A/B